MGRYLTPSAAQLFLLRENNGRTEVLLQERAGGIWASGWWEATAAGHVEEGESMTECLIREAKEEIGIEIKKKNIVFINFQHSRVTLPTDTHDMPPYYNGYFFVSKYDGTSKVCEHDKCDCLKWFDVNNLPEKLLPHKRQAIKDFLASITYTEFGWDR